MIITPPFIVIIFILVPLINFARPWSAGESELKNYGYDGLAICVGMSSSRSRITDKDISVTQRNYLLVAKGELASVTETHENDERTVNLDTSKLNFWIISAVFLIFVWLSARFSIPQLAIKLKPTK